MNGASFDISINAQNRGVDASAAELNALAGKIQQVDTVATSFDGAVAAATMRLQSAAAAAQIAASALSAAEKQYSELEGAANRSAKALERATAAGKETTELAAAAEAAKAAMVAQGSAVDALRAKSEAAAAAQKELADTLGTLKGQQKVAAAEIKKGTEAQTASTHGTELSIAAYLSIARTIWRVVKAVYGAAKAFAEFLVGQNPAAVAKLNTAYAKMTANFKALFSGLKFDKLVDGLTNVMSMFDKGTASARGMKTLVEYMFQPLIDGAAAAMPYIKAFLNGMIHGALLVVIAILKIRNAIFDAMSPETRAFIKKLIDNVFSLQNAFEAGKYVAIAFAVAIGVMVAAMAAMLVVELLLVAPIIAIIEAIKNWGAITKWLKEKWDGVVDWIGSLWDNTVGKALKWGANLAANIIAGLTGGLAEGGPATAKAMDKVLDAAQQGAAKKLDSHSPSRVYEKFGTAMHQGLVGGIEGGASDVQDAVETMVAAPNAPGGGGGQGGGGSKTIHIEHLTIGDSPVAQSTFADFKRTMLEVLEGASLSIGGGEAPAT